MTGASFPDPAAMEAALRVAQLEPALEASRGMLRTVLGERERYREVLGEVLAAFVPSASSSSESPELVARATPQRLRQWHERCRLPIADPQWEIFAGFLCERTDECTCEGEPHRPECGLEPLVDMTEVDNLDALAELLGKART